MSFGDKKCPGVQLTGRRTTGKLFTYGTSLNEISSVEILCMLTKSDIVFFLRSHPAIAKINFTFGSFKVYPLAYWSDVAHAIGSGEVELLVKPLPPTIAASYDVLYDQLTIAPTFGLVSIPDQATLVHESTHIYLDILKIGWHSRHVNEAVAYLAEAVFLEAGGHSARAPKSISAISHTIARSILSGTSSVTPADVALLSGTIASHPHYSTFPKYVSNGFDRDLLRNLLR